MNNFANKYRTTILLILIILLGFFLRVRLSQDQCLHKWDERFHALVAKNILKHPLKPTLYDEPVLRYDYTQWFSNHVWLHKPPMPLWIIAISYEIFGVNEFAVRVPSIFFSTLAIFITFLLGKYLFSEKVGLLAAFFFSINGVLIEMASGRVTTDHYDTLFMVFIEIYLLFAYYNSSKGKWIYSLIAGLFLGLALLTKWLPALIVIPVHFLFLLDKGYNKIQMLKFIGTSIFIGVIISLPWQIYIFNHYPIEAKWESHYNWLHFVKELEGHVDDEGFLYYFNKLQMSYSEIIYIPLIFFLYTLKRNYKNYKLWSLFVWIFIPIFIFSFAKMKLQGYILFISPALFIITAEFFFYLKDIYLKQARSKVITIFSIILLMAIIALPLRYCFERTDFGLKAPKHEDYTDRYKSFVGSLPKNAVALNIQYPIEFMFYNDCVAYSNSQINEVIQDSIVRSGFRVFLYEEKNNSFRELIK